MLNYDVEPVFCVGSSTRHGAGLVQGTNVHQPCGLSILPHKATRVFPVPFHADFDEVNLRFYVRRKQGSDDRRGVVSLPRSCPVA